MPTAQSADGVLHRFPDGTDPAVIDRVMKAYAQKVAPSPAAAQPGAESPKSDAVPAPQPGAPAARKIAPEEPSDEKVNVGSILPVSTRLGQKRRVERGPSKFGFDPEAGILSPVVEGSKIATGKRDVGTLTPGEALGMAAFGVGRPAVKGRAGVPVPRVEAPKPSVMAIPETVKRVEQPEEAPKVPAAGQKPPSQGRVTGVTAGPEETKPPVGPILDPPPGAESVKGLSVRLSDGLHRLHTNGSADKVEAAQFLQSLDRQQLDPAFQAKVYDEIEERMKGPPREPPAPVLSGYRLSDDPAIVSQVTKATKPTSPDTVLLAIEKDGKGVGILHGTLRGEDFHIVGTSMYRSDRVGSLGPSAVRDLMRQIKQKYPQVKTISGQRISGARRAAGLGASRSNAKVEIPGQSPTTKTGFSPDVAAFIDQHLKPWKAEENSLASNLKRRLGKDAGLMDLPGYQEGYVHRIVRGKGQYFDRLDPEAARQQDPVMGQGRTLSKRASSLQPRQFWVLEDAQGRRAWAGGGNPEWTPGQTRRGTDGKAYTAKLATTAEIEAHTPVRYYKNAAINTVENVLRLRRVTRNLDLLETIKPQLEQRGLYKARGTNEPVPQGWKRITLPQLDGFADPKIANVLNDFHGELMRGGDLAQLGAKINRFLVGSLFFTPLPHAANVMNHWIIGRGFDWLRPAGLHSLAVDGARAMKAVIMKDPQYIRMLREGSALIQADVGNANFYKLMIEKMSGEILRDPQTWTGVAKNLGFRTPIDLVRMIYKTSSKLLWGANDVFMLQRQFELMRKGMPVRQAIAEAEKDIPNYRIPSEVMGKRWVSEVLQNPNLTMFGRYHYGLWRALSSMITDIVRPMEKGQRMEATGKLLVLGLLAFGAYPMASAAVKKITGNPDADVQRYGPLGPLQAMAEFSQGQRDWVATVSSLMSPSPVIRGVGEAATNRDVFGREIINPQSSPLGIATQAGEAVAGQIAPLQQAMTMAKPGGTAQVLARNVGVKLPSPGAKAGKIKGKAIEKKQAARREARDPVEQAIRRATGP